MAKNRTRDQSNKRQADHILAAFRYQLLHSLDAWVRLRPNEVLWLEIEEDYSVTAADGTTDVQVKRSAAAAGPTHRSLQSADVRDVLDRYWTRSDNGNDGRSQLVFIANSGAAQERGLSFPDHVPGLIYWGRAAQDSDTSSIRQALTTVFSGHPIGDWINTQPSDDELRAKLLRRVQWALNSQDVAPLTELIRDEIAEIYLSKGLWATLADEAIRGLLDRVFETASEREPQDRQLTSLDLHRSLEQAAGPSTVLQSTARALSGTSINIAGGEVFVSPLSPATPNITDRQSTVDEILARLRTEPMVWLHGTHGTGKSTLARLLAQRIGSAWLVVDLRAVQDDAKAALAVWRELIRAVLQAPQLRGIIVDDLAGPAFDALRSRVAALVALNAPRGVRFIVTSSYVPSAARFAELGASTAAAVQAPYFTEDEVLALVRRQGGPSEESAKGWARLILITTNGGHPLLVAAKIASLRSRAWPADALVEDIGLRTSDAVQNTREEARRRLLEETPSDNARQLLRRIGCVFDRADDALVIRLAQAEPAIANPTDILAILRGSWVEVMPRNDLRLSPLIADIGRDVTEDDTLRWRRIAAEHWLSTRVLDERTLPLCFWNAFLGKHNWVLATLCQLIETLPREHLDRAAALLSPMVAFVTDRSIYPEAPPIAVMLRLLQFEVANAIEDSSAASKIATRLLLEIAAVEPEQLRLLQFSIAAPKVLLAANADVSPTFQVDCALRLRGVQQRIQRLDVPAAQRAVASMNQQFEPGLDLSAFLLAVAINRIHSSDRMLAMIEALDALGESDRNGFIDGAAIALQMSPGYFVHFAWVQDQLGDRDLRPALSRLERMSEIVKPWGRSDIQIELVCARSVVLDEGLDDQPAAIAVVDASLEEFGSVPALIRQKAKVLSHAGDDRAATDLIVSVEDTVGAGHPFDRYLALREGGVSAARAEMFDDALRLFNKAHAVLPQEGDDVTRAAGIQIEIALTLWEALRRADALTAIADAFDAVEPLDPIASRQNERVHQFARAVGGQFWRDLDPYSSRSRPSVAIGQASALAGDEPLLRVDLKPLADNWRILALCEIELGVDVGIERRSLVKQSRPGLASIEIFIASARYAQALPQDDIKQVFSLGLAALSAKKVMFDLRAAGSGEVRLTDQELASKNVETLLTEGWREIVQTIPLDLLIWHKFQNRWDGKLLARIEEACASSWGDAISIGDILAVASGNSSVDANPPGAVALAAALAPTFDPTGMPLARFRRDLLLVSHTAHSSARRILEPLIMSELVNGWTAVIQNEGFALRAPLQHGPLIEEGVTATRNSGLKGAVRLLRAAAPAVRFPLGDQWEQFLRMIAA